MPITKPVFDFGFGNLEAAFGRWHDSRRAGVYFEELRDVIDEERWKRIVKYAMRVHEHFPTLKDLLDIARQYNKSNEVRVKEIPVTEYLCSVRECIDGYIFIYDGIYRSVARCPICNREPTGIPLFKGDVHHLDDREMEMRRR